MTLLKLVQIHILWLLEDGCSCRVWCVLFHSESNNCYGNSGQCMIVSAQIPKWQWMVLVYYSRYCYETTIHHTIYLIIWHYIYIYTVQDWLGFWIFPWYVFLVMGTRNRTTSRKYYSWKLLLLGPGFNFKISHQTVPVCEMMFGGQIDILVGIFRNLFYY